MAKLVWKIQIVVIIISITVYSQKIAGPFYCVNEGFFPRTLENELVEYVTDIKSMKGNYEDKRMYGVFNLKKTVKNLRAVSHVYKESGNSWLKRGMPIQYDNLCQLSFNMDNFKKCFSGYWDGDPCTLKAGQYNLTNWTFEYDLKQSLPNMFYGHYKFQLYVLGEVDELDGEKEIELPLELRLWVKDESQKKSQGGSKGKGEEKKKQKKN